MYCERCGRKIDEALNFCSGCGAQLKKEGESGQSILKSLISALIAVAIAGLGILVAILVILLDRVPNFDPVVVFGAIYLAVLFGICFLITRQISKLIDAKLEKRDFVETARSQPLIQLPTKTTAQLDEFREPASVIESTTRTLDKVPVQRD